MAITVGSTQVEVVPDLSTFNEKVKAHLATLRGVVLGVDADTTEAEARIEELGRNHTATVNVAVDGARAEAELAHISRDRTSTIRVDTVGGIGSAAGAAESGGGLSGFGSLALAGAGAAALFGPSFGAAAIGGVAALATGIGAVGAAAVTTKLGLAGVGSAIKAIDEAQKGAAVSAAQLASAHAALSTTIANADSASVRSAEAVSNARASVADAERAAAQGIAAAIRTEVAAEADVQAAQKASTQAQRDLIQAREDARQQLADLANQVKDGALSERQATLDVQKAQEDLNRARIDPTLTKTERDQAQLTFDQAVQHLAELKVRNARLNDQKAEADKAGVKGSDAVIAAQQAVEDAHRRVVAAQGAELAAAKAVTEARRSGAEAVARAEQGVTDALRNQVDTARNSAAAIAAARAALDAANAKSPGAVEAAALANLTPAGQAFVKFYETQLRPRIKALQDTAQAGLLPGLQAGITSALPIFGTLQRIVGNAASAVGDLIARAGAALTNPFWTKFLTSIQNNIGPAILTAGKVIGDLATAFAGLFEAFLPNSQKIGASLTDLADRFAAWATTLDSNKGFQKFLVYVRDNGPAVAKSLAEFAVAFASLVRDLAPISTFATKALDILVKLFNFVGGPLAPIGLNDLSGKIRALKDDAQATKDGIVKAFDAVVTFFSHLPGRIADASRGMFDGIKNAFTAAINFIIKAWNGLSFGIPGVNTHIPGVGKIGGFTLNTPDIPLLAKGGIVTDPTLLVAGEAGPEAIVPLAQMDAFARSLSGQAFSGGVTRGAGGDVTVHQVINNPLPERASVSAPVGLRRAAAALGRA